MKRCNGLKRAALALALAMTAWTAQSAMVMQMGLGDLVGNADKVFRGTVVSKEPGTVAAGGSELPVVIYTLAVNDAIKGDFGSGKDAATITLTLLGNLKADAAGSGQQRLFKLDVNPQLDVGSEYVLFTTAPSAAGLSTTVGLDQGLFRVINTAQGSEMAANGLGNQGLFDGPVSYDELKAAINAEIR